MYSDKEIEFLCDECDTVHYYETKGKEEATPASQYAKGMQALSNMDRIQQVEMLQGIVNLKRL